MDFTRALKFAFKDNEWFKKFCIGVGVLAVPIVGFALYGYSLDTARNVSHADDRLPEWGQFRKFFREGFKFGIGRCVYFIPLWIVQIGFLIGLPFTFQRRLELGDLNKNILLFFFLILVLAAFSMIYRIAFQFIYPEIVINYLRKNSFESLFEWRCFLDIYSSAKSEFLKASGYSIALLILGNCMQVGLQILLSFIPGFGNFLAAIGATMGFVWADLASFHLYGQLHGKLTQVE